MEVIENLWLGSGCALSRLNNPTEPMNNQARICVYLLSFPE